MWYGISYSQTAIPYQTPFPLHFMTSFPFQSTEMVSFHIIWYGYCSEKNTLPPPSDSLLKMQAVDSSETLLPRPHYVSPPLCKPEIKNLETQMTKSVDSSCWEYWVTRTTLCPLTTQYLMPQCFAPLLCYGFFLLTQMKKKVKRYHKIKSS
jgi:hypothetical protein